MQVYKDRGENQLDIPAGAHGSAAQDIGRGAAGLPWYGRAQHTRPVVEPVHAHVFSGQDTAEDKLQHDTMAAYRQLAGAPTDRHISDAP